MTTGSIDPEVADELRFHLRELHYDLLGLCENCARPLPAAGAEASAFRRLLYDLAYIDVAVEHEATHHGPEALRLAQTLAGLEITTPPPNPAATLSEDWARSIPAVEAYAMLQEEFRRLREAVPRAQAAQARAAVAEGEELTGSAARVQALTELVQVLVTEAQSAAARALALAEQLYRLADPAAAAEEDRLAELETPLRELYRPDARKLAICPYCGAPLGSDDRTLDGSFCDGCRTHWSTEPAPPPSGSGV